MAEATEWQLLYQSIRNTLLRSNVEHLSPISEVTKVVINWGEQRQGTSRASFAVVKEYINMKMLADWQKEFFSLLQKESDIKKAIFFRLRDCENVWVEICHPTTENILRYSELYMQFLHSKIDENLFFEFIVFGVGEANEQSLPRDAISFDLK